MSVTTISLLVGVSISLLAFQLIFLFSRVPVEDRAWRDRPVFAFRIIWPAICAIDHYVTRGFSAKHHNRIAKRLSEAGLEYTFTSGQFVASRIVSSVALTSFFALALHQFASAWVALAALAIPWGYAYPVLWVNRVIKKRQHQLERDLPFYLDIVTLAIESGTNLTGALTQAVQKAPESPLKHEFSRVLRDVRAGKSRSDALRELSDRANNPSLSSVLSGMIQAEKSGASLGPVMRAQATQLRKARFAAAEKRAMEAPVKLLAPLVMFIFPTTFIVLSFLVVSKMIQQNMITWAPVVWAFYWPS